MAWWEICLLALIVIGGGIGGGVFHKRRVYKRQYPQGGPKPRPPGSSGRSGCRSG